MKVSCDHATVILDKKYYSTIKLDISVQDVLSMLVPISSHMHCLLSDGSTSLDKGAISCAEWLSSFLYWQSCCLPQGVSMLCANSFLQLKTKAFYYTISGLFHYQTAPSFFKKIEAFLGEIRRLHFLKKIFHIIMEDLPLLVLQRICLSMSSGPVTKICGVAGHDTAQG